MDNLFTASANTTTGQDLGNSWDWQLELEKHSTRLARNRNDETAAVRRSAEEAERANLRRLEDVERRILRYQAEESTALQGFLSSWNSALEVRLEKQRVYVSGRLDAIERKLLSEDVLTRVDEARALALEAQRSVESCSSSVESCSSRLESFSSRLESFSSRLESFSSQLEPYIECMESVKSMGCLQTWRGDMVAEVSRASADSVAKMHDLREEIMSLEACRSQQIEQRIERMATEMEVLESSTKKIQADSESEWKTSVHGLDVRVASVEGRALESLSKIPELAAIIEKQAFDVTDLRSALDSNNLSVRSVLQHVENRAGESSDSIFSELRDLRGHCESRLEAQALTTAETCRNLAGEMSELMQDGVTRAELAAANLDSKVAGALDAVMDARVAKSAKASAEEAMREAMAATTALETKLRGSEAFSERLLREELQQARTRELQKFNDREGRESRLGAEITSLREEFQCHLHDTSENLKTVTANYGRLSEEFKRLQSAGLSHEWCIPRCLHRIRYLSMSTEAGLWLDSESFTLGSIGPLTLRLYPRGVRGGDGRCAISLRMEQDVRTSLGAFSIPSCVDLSVATMRGRGSRTDEDDGGAAWLVQSLGDIEDHVAKCGDDLRICVEIPQLQSLPTVSIDAPDSKNVIQAVLIENQAPQEFKAALHQRRSQELNGTLLSAETLTPEDIASTVTVGSDARCHDTKPRTVWTIEEESELQTTEAANAKVSTGAKIFQRVLGQDSTVGASVANPPALATRSVGNISTCPPGRTNPFDTKNPFAASSPSVGSPNSSTFAAAKDDNRPVQLPKTSGVMWKPGETARATNPF